MDMKQAECQSLFTEDFFTRHYVVERKSYPAIRAMLAEQGMDVSVACIHKYAKKLGFGRTVSEGKRNLDPNPLDYRVSYLSENCLESVDGLLLGDGSIELDSRSSTDVARLTWGVEHEEFARYFASNTGSFLPTVNPYKASSMKSGIMWQGRTKTHPDLFNQRKRWYGNGKKQPPNDVRLTPKSVMMWYLGDGSLVCTDASIVVRLSTDGFATERVEFLAQKMCDMGIACHRNNDNRIQIDARGVAAFFDFIGRKSPVSCYSYKFEIPEWRFSAKRMKEVATELNVDYHRLAYFVKIGRVPCMRLSDKGKPRFLPEHIEVVRDMVSAGEI